MKTTGLKILGAALTSLLCTGAAFGQTAVPFNFTPGTPARAAEVNSNFQALTGAINANSAGIGANSAAIAANISAISTNTAEIAANQFLRVVLVKPVIGDPTASGTALLDAMAGITSTGPGNTWVILVEPGLYDLGGASLVMKPWVTVRGFGKSSVITSSVDSLDSGTVEGADDSGLVDLKIQNTGGGVNAIGVYYDFVRSGGLRNVTVQASGSANNVGVALDNGSDLNFSHLKASASGGLLAFGLLLQAASKVLVSDSVIFAGAPTAGTTNNIAVYNNSSSLVIVNSDIQSTGTGNIAIFNIGTPAGPVEIHRSSVRADTGFGGKALVAPTGFTVNVAVSLLEGPKAGIGTFNCFNSYTPSFTLVGVNC